MLHHRVIVAALATLAALASPAQARAAEPRGGSFCDPALSARIPARPSAAPGGRELARRLAGLDGAPRETLIREQLLAGNVPAFLRHLRPVVLEARAVVCVMPDYLALGSDADFLLVPMRLETALAVAERFGFTLPTRKLVDAIHAQSALRLAPQPLPASDAMRSTAYFVEHDRLVGLQRAAFGVELGTLIAGDKKDLVLSNRLWRLPDRVAIYGWHTPAGTPIQPLSTVHGWRYADYSHGVRLVSAVALIDGERRSLLEALEDPRAAQVLSDEGPIPRLAELLTRLLEPEGLAFAALGPRD